jgi:hypothetical protein
MVNDGGCKVKKPRVLQVLRFIREKCDVWDETRAKAFKDMKMAKQDAEDLFRDEGYDKGIEGKTWAKTFTAVLQALFKSNKVPPKNMTLFLQKRRYQSGFVCVAKEGES